MLAATRSIVKNIPFHEQPALLPTAHDLLLLFHYVAAPAWRLAMAICLNQQSALQQLRQRAPKLWRNARACILHDPELQALLSSALQQ